MKQRPAVSEVVSLRLTKETLALIQELAEKEDRSISAMIRRLLAFAIRTYTVE